MQEFSIFCVSTNVPFKDLRVLTFSRHALASRLPRAYLRSYEVTSSKIILDKPAFGSSASVEPGSGQRSGDGSTAGRSTRGNIHCGDHTESAVHNVSKWAAWAGAVFFETAAKSSYRRHKTLLGAPAGFQAAAEPGFPLKKNVRCSGCFFL